MWRFLPPVFFGLAIGAIVTLATFVTPFIKDLAKNRALTYAVWSAKRNARLRGKCETSAAIGHGFALWSILFLVLAVFAVLVTYRTPMLGTIVEGVGWSITFSLLLTGCLWFRKAIWAFRYREWREYEVAGSDPYVSRGGYYDYAAPICIALVACLGVVGILFTAQ